ncbi:hypothetical protein [Aquidulcibacter paucihalophilus]|uniref:hypothetical protein n=1 Tax=Aquidulcibacter paucihalophilus TaxID=1978549 RepID=UPI000A1924B0|nr:hypothetical protein [Aquidulcibacter paucihalophilus]
MNPTQPDDTNRDLVTVAIQPNADAPLDSAADEIGPLSDFIRRQPVLTLSIAFGLGLLVTSLLARKRT